MAPDWWDLPDLDVVAQARDVADRGFADLFTFGDGGVRLADGAARPEHAERMRSALACAVRRGCQHVVELLIDAGADPSEVTLFSIHRDEAPYSIRPDLLERLVEAGADAEAPGPEGARPLLEAIQRRDSRVAWALLLGGATAEKAASSADQLEEFRAELPETERWCAALRRRLIDVAELLRSTPGGASARLDAVEPLIEDMCAGFGGKYLCVEEASWRADAYEAAEIEDVLVGWFGADYRADVAAVRRLRAAGAAWAPDWRSHAALPLRARRAVEAAAPTLLALARRPGPLRLLPAGLLHAVVDRIGADEGAGGSGSESDGCGED